MKIINDVHRQRDTSYARQAPTETKSFQHSLQSQYLSQKKQELDNMMKNISLQGEKLAHSRNFKELAKFKKMIKSFLGETVSGGLRIKKEQSFNRNGSNHLTLIKQVDEKLIELTEQIMSQEKKTVDILGIIGEIKGLLINIYI